MHFTALASRYLDAPRLHRGSHAGSQSASWRPRARGTTPRSSVWRTEDPCTCASSRGVDAERLSCSYREVWWRDRAIRRARRFERVDRDSSERFDCWRGRRRADGRDQARECGVVPPNRWGPFAQLCALTASVARDTSGGPSGPTASQETSNLAPKRLLPPARVCTTRRTIMSLTSRAHVARRPNC